MKKTSAKAILLSIVGALAVGIGSVWFVGGELIAPVKSEIGAPPADLGAQAIAFTSESGSTIRGWLSSGSPGQGAVLLLHGVRGSRLDMVSRAQFLHRLGYAVLLIDFQSHGASRGNGITFGYLESRDVEAALRFLNGQYPSERLGVIGVSMGAAAVVLAKHRPGVRAVVLESMYPTIGQATEDRLRLYLGTTGAMLAPLLTGQIRLRLGVDTETLQPISRIGDLQAPVFIISGTLDRHTRIEEARAIYAAAVQPKQFWAVEGAAHVDLHRFATAEYESRVGDFLGAHLPSRANNAEPNRVASEDGHSQLGRSSRRSSLDPSGRDVWATQFPPVADLFTQKADGFAWRSKPNWSIVATKDRTVQPDLERFLAKRMRATMTEVPSSHVVMLSHPKVVLEVIRSGAKAVQKSGSQ